MHGRESKRVKKRRREMEGPLGGGCREKCSQRMEGLTCEGERVRTPQGRSLEGGGGCVAWNSCLTSGLIVGAAVLNATLHTTRNEPHHKWLMMEDTVNCRSPVL